MNGWVKQKEQKKNSWSEEMNNHNGNLTIPSVVASEYFKSCKSRSPYRPRPIKNSTFGTFDYHFCHHANHNKWKFQNLTFYIRLEMEPARSTCISTPRTINGIQTVFLHYEWAVFIMQEWKTSITKSWRKQRRTSFPAVSHSAASRMKYSWMESWIYLILGPSSIIVESNFGWQKRSFRNRMI